MTQATGSGDDGSDTPYRAEFVESLPDLIDESEYAEHPRGGLVRIRISADEAGVHVLGDAFRPEVLESLLAALGDGSIEQMLCG